MGILVLELADWVEVSVALSLDCVLPVYAELGLSFVPASTFQQALRAALLRHARALVPTEFAEQSALMTEVLEGIRASFGAEGADSFGTWRFRIAQDWATDSYTDHSQQNRFRYYYRSAILEWAGSMRHAHTDRIGFQTDTTLILRRFEELASMRFTQKVMSRVASGLESQWDQEVLLMERAHLGGREAVTPTRTQQAKYMGIIETAVEQNGFVLFWEELLEVCNDDDLASVRSFALRRNPQLQTLPHPRSLL